MSTVHVQKVAIPLRSHLVKAKSIKTLRVRSKHRFDEARLMLSDSAANKFMVLSISFGGREQLPKPTPAVLFTTLVLGTQFGFEEVRDGDEIRVKIRNISSRKRRVGAMVMGTLSRAEVPLPALVDGEVP